MYAYRRLGSARMAVITQLLQRIGIFPIRDHYYEPLFNKKRLRKLLSEDRHLPGLRLEDEAQLCFLKLLKYSHELGEMELDRRAHQDGHYFLNNENFESGDADFLFQFIRSIKPKRIIEIGGGHSTKIAKEANDRNRVEAHQEFRHTCIEPYEMAWIENLGIEVIRKKVEDCPLTLFQELESGDLLFIDSSHMIRPQGDVLFEYHEILPALKSGVYVHIHDIFSPKDYPRSWVVDHVRFWNEQYLLEAMLSNNRRYEIVASLNYLKHHYYTSLKEVCPYLTPDREPGSFYLRIN